ncbi:MAG: acyltransferase, partial [Opitutae bacterium]|nr:acyltransferase [Opitutae bacterium]
MSQYLRYRPEIDGLRALAVVPVIIFHLNSNLISGGFVGVDIFFVISGFLITQIIIKESTAHRFTFRNFWARRVKRIMPALLVVLSTTIVATITLSFRDTWGIVGLQGFSVLALFANFAMWRISGDYWGPQAEDLSLLHTWSLSLEEQFYLF